MECGLSIHQQRISVRQVTIHNLASSLELVGDSIPLLVSHATQKCLNASLFIKNHVSSWMTERSISHHTGQPFSIDLADTFGEGQLTGHEDGHADLVSGDVWVGRDDRTTAIVDMTERPP